MSKAEDKAAAAKAAAVKGEKNGETVTVALKHPTGIILQGYKKEKGQEPVLGGGYRDTVVFKPTGEQYPLHGTRVPFGATPAFKVLCGYALTPNIPKDLWEMWQEQHADSPLLANNLIMAFNSLEDAEDGVQDGKDLRSGMEPMLRSGDPRVDKKKTREGKFVDSIVIADEQPAAG